MSRQYTPPTVDPSYFHYAWVVVLALVAMFGLWLVLSATILRVRRGAPISDHEVGATVVGALLLVFAGAAFLDVLNA